MGVTADSSGCASGVPSLQRGGNGVCRAAECWENCCHCSDLSGVLISSLCTANTAPHTCLGGSQHSSTHQGISQLQFLFPPPGHGACPSPGKCGMIRFSVLMSPDSMGNISFSAFCRAEPGTTVRMVPGEHCDTHSSAPILTPFLVLALLPPTCVGWIPHLGTVCPGTQSQWLPPSRGKTDWRTGPRSLF